MDEAYSIYEFAKVQTYHDEKSLFHVYDLYVKIINKRFKEEPDIRNLLLETADTWRLHRYIELIEELYGHLEDHYNDSDQYDPEAKFGLDN